MQGSSPQGGDCANVTGERCQPSPAGAVHIKKHSQIFLENSHLYIDSHPSIPVTEQTLTFVTPPLPGGRGCPGVQSWGDCANSPGGEVGQDPYCSRDKILFWGQALPAFVGSSGQPLPTLRVVSLGKTAVSLHRLPADSLAHPHVRGGHGKPSYRCPPAGRVVQPV